jgi:hypothetical protein
MALPTQRIKIDKYRSKMDPGPRDRYLLMGLMVSVFGGALGVSELSRYGNLVFGLTLTSLFIFYLAEQFREHIGTAVDWTIAVLSSSAAIVATLSTAFSVWSTLFGELDPRCPSDRPAYACRDALRQMELRDAPVELIVDTLPLVLFVLFFLMVFACNRRYYPKGELAT